MAKASKAAKEKKPAKASKAAKEKKPAKAKEVAPVQRGSKKVEQDGSQAWERGESVKLAKAE